MDLWDRLCCLLRARTVSVEDVSNKVNDMTHCLTRNQKCMHCDCVTTLLFFTSNCLHVGNLEEVEWLWSSQRLLHWDVFASR